MDQLLNVIAHRHFSQISPDAKNIFYNMANANVFDSGAGMSFVELVRLAEEKGLVEVETDVNGVQYLSLIFSKRS
jgi:hypothetical protein